MRITSFMIFNQLTRSLQRNLEEMSGLYNQVSSGKKINKPSDNVIGLMRAMDYKLSINDNAQYKRNIGEAEAHQDFTEKIMSSVSDALIRAKELALQGVTGTESAESRAAAAEEVTQIRDHLLNMANSKFRDRYIFSGFKTNIQSFNAATFDYQGSSGIINTIVDKGASMPINIPGDEAFSYFFSSVVHSSADPGNTGGADVTAKSISDRTALTFHKYEINFTAPTTYDVVDVDTGATIISGATYTSGSHILFDGLDIVISDVFSAPQAGDIFRISVNPLKPSTLNYSSDADITANISNHFDLTKDVYEVSFDGAGNYSVQNVNTGAVVATGVYVSGGTITFDGLDVIITGTVTSSDKFFVSSTELIQLDEDGKYAHYYPGTGTTINADIRDAYDTTFLDSFSFSNFIQMTDILSSALESNNISRIRALLEPLNNALDQVTNVQAGIGARLNRLDDQTNRLDDSTLNLKTVLSNTEDADLTEVFSEISKTEVALEALRRSVAEVLSQSLLDFLK
ncbi:MAG: flagellar hook-associated protein FlgL [Nitrospirota bacterium]